MRATLRVSAETLTAVVHIASFAIIVGAFAAIHTQSLRTGLMILGTAFFSGCLGFIYSVWRLFRPRWRARQRLSYEAISNSASLQAPLHSGQGFGPVNKAF